MQILNFLVFEHSASRRNAIGEELGKVSKNRVCDDESVLRTQPGIRICYIDRNKTHPGRRYLAIFSGPPQKFQQRTFCIAGGSF
jgi:hypothetical protein